MQNYCCTIKKKLNAIIRKMEKNSSDFVVSPEINFTRKSTLSFSETMKFILGMGGKTLGKELMDFYDFHADMVSVSAVVQRRTKIKPYAFEYLFHSFSREFSPVHFFMVIICMLLTVQMCITLLISMMKQIMSVPLKM